MNTNSNPLDDMLDPDAPLFDASNTGGSYSSRSNSVLSRQGSEEEQDAAFVIAELRKQVESLSKQAAEERLLNQKLLVLFDSGKNLENTPDAERPVQNLAHTICQLLHCELICIFRYQPQENQFKLLTSSGPAARLLPNNFQPDAARGLIQQAIRTQSVLSSHNINHDNGTMVIGMRPFPSVLAAPLMRGQALHGLILAADSMELAFEPQDSTVLAAAGAQILTLWGYAQQNDTLTEFVQAVTMLSVIQEAGSLTEMVASIGRRTLGAAYALVATRSQQGWMLRGAGRAPLLLRSLQNGASSFLEEAIQSPYTFRLRELQNDARAASIQLDTPELCSMLASPIRVNGIPAGILLAFGKIGADNFNDLDVFLAELLGAQASVNLESCYLNQELRANLKTTQLLYDLSLSITQAENLTEAAHAIGLAAYRLMGAHKCGLILFSSNGQTEAEVRFPGDDPGVVHPKRLIQQAMDSRQAIYLSENEHQAQNAIPIQTMRRCYGALWMEFSEDNEENRHPTEEIRILINQAAVALERSILLEETRQQTGEIDRAYQSLKSSYEDLLSGLTKALDARDSDTEGHSQRVEELSEQLGIEMGLSWKELQALKRGALLHDIGKIGVPDNILNKPGPLDDIEWDTMRQHPDKGAEIIEEISALKDALPVIKSHQERWDGSGYPEKLTGAEIPLLARIFAVVDVYDALTSNRPYRQAMPVPEALAYLENQAGIHFDRDVVTRFCSLIRLKNIGK